MIEEMEDYLSSKYVKKTKTKCKKKKDRWIKYTYEQYLKYIYNTKTLSLLQPIKEKIHKDRDLTTLQKSRLYKIYKQKIEII